MNSESRQIPGGSNFSGKYGFLSAMNRKNTARGLLVTLLLACLWASGATPAGANTEPSFEMAEGFPRKVGKSVNQVETISIFDKARGSIAVLDPVGHQLKVFRNQPRGTLNLELRRHIPESIGGWSVSDFGWGRGAQTFSVTNPVEQTVTAIEGPFRNGGSGILHVAKMGGPVEAVQANFSSRNNRVEMPFIGVSPSTDELLIEYMNYWLEFWTAEPLKVGDQPVAMSWAWTRDLPENHEAMITVNKGSDDVTLVDVEWLWDKYKPPTPTVLENFPVGDQPVDVVAWGKRIFVVNQGSDSVSQISLEADGLHEVAEYPVGDAPTSISFARLTRDKFPDLVVTNGGSDDVSFLVGNEDGSFRDGGRTETGDHPVDVKPISFDRFFANDLLVANEGDGTITILKWHETTGTCNGSPARLFKMPLYHTDLSGSNDPDRAIGGPFGDDIYTGAGGDCVSGLKGKDNIEGGYDADRINGGPGDDEITGNHGPDVLRGGPGDDYLCENYDPTAYISGEWCCAEGRGAYFEGNDRRNEMYGGPGDDTLESGWSRDMMYGGPGNDLIISRARKRPDRIFCGPGRDVAQVTTETVVRGCEVVKRS